MPVDVRTPGGPAPSSMNSIAFSPKCCPASAGVANTRTIIPVKRIKETTAVKIA
jgi:hypothetical protein